MESLLSGISTLSPESLFDLYGEDLKNFYQRVEKHGRQDAEWCRLFNWIIPAPFRILVAGEYNHGKTALINYLLGRNNLLPVSPKRETKITTYVFPLYFSNFSGFGVNHEHALLVNKKENSFRIIQLPELKSVINDPNLVPDDYDLYVYLDNKLLYRNVVFIDTPGFIVDRDNEWYPLALAKTSDLILAVSDLNKPFTRYHSRFISQIGNHARKIVLSVNKADLATSTKDIREAMTHLAAHKREYAFCIPHFLISTLDLKIDVDRLMAEMDACTVSSINDSMAEEKLKPLASPGDNAETMDDYSSTDAHKPGEWDNRKLWEYLYREISMRRFARRAENWTLNMVDLFGQSRNLPESEVHVVFSGLCESLREAKGEMALFEEIHRNTLNITLITDDIIEKKLRQFADGITRIEDEATNAINAGIVEKISKCARKKDIEIIQQELQKDIRRHIEAVLSDIQALIDRETASLNLYWFKTLGEIPDGRLIDDELSPARASELRSLLYEHLFEEQYFWRMASWDGLAKLMQQKGFTRACGRKDHVAWFLHAVRSLFFDCTSPDYILRDIVECLEFPKMAESDVKRVRHVGWSTIKSPGFLFLGTSVTKYRSHVRQHVQNYQLEKFNALKKLIARCLSEYEETAKRALKDIERRLRSSLAQGILELRADTNRRSVRRDIEKLERTSEGMKLPFDNE